MKVKSWTDPLEQIVEYTPWWLKTRHGVKKIEIEEFLHRPQGLVVHLKGINDRSQAEELGRIDIAIEKQLLPVLEEGEFYWHQLLGLKVTSCFEGRKTPLGVVDRLLETGANDVLVVKPDQGSVDDRERLVPYVPDLYIKNVDIDQGCILVNWDPDF